MIFHIGTSGFSYTHWKGLFYPAGTPQRSWLEFYATQFDCVEINSSFYHLPRTAVLDSWYTRTPDNFMFVLKGSRTVTHMKRLKDCRESVELLYDRACHVKHKLGPVLWQLPPGLSVDCDLMENFLDMLPAKPKAVIEFRNPSWYVEEVYNLLRKRRIALCIHDMPSKESPRVVTSSLTYLRFHGTSGRYSGGYSDERLAKYAEWIIESGATEVYGFFNNDIHGHAVRDALTLRRLLEGHTR